MTKINLNENLNKNSGLFTDEGKLIVDILQTTEHLIVLAPLAGVEVESIDLYIQNDLLTIKGKRINPIKDEDVVEYYYQECFWGNFSRTIILPFEVKTDLVEAEYKNGLLLVKIPKPKNIDNKIPIKVIEE